MVLTVRLAPQAQQALMVQMELMVQMVQQARKVQQVLTVLMVLLAQQALPVLMVLTERTVLMVLQVLPEQQEQQVLQAQQALRLHPERLWLLGHYALQAYQYLPIHACLLPLILNSMMKEGCITTRYLQPPKQGTTTLT